MIAATKNKKTKPAATALVPACGYIRMSTGQQDASPARQRAEIEKLAKTHGYAIIRWYSDEGISGAATSKRKEFLQLVKDAEAKADFQVILCWDLSRFGRFDSIEAGRFVEPLRRAGVRLHTVTDGIIDWNSFAGRLLYTVAQEGKAQFLVDLSKNTISGQRRKAAAGEMLSRTPFGYCKRIYDEKGEFVRVVGYCANFRRPPTWKAEMVPSEDDGAADLVRWLFETFASTDTSMRALADEMAKKAPWATKRAGMNVWLFVKQILTNPTYVGDYRYGLQQSRRIHKTETLPMIFIENHHAAIVSRDLFDRVQAKLTERRRERRKPREAGGRLNGVVYCGHCGKRLVLRSCRKDSAYYACNDPVDCTRRHITAKRLEGILIDIVRQAYDGPQAKQALTRAIERRTSKQAAGSTAERRRLAKELDKLDAKIERAKENILLIDRAEIPDAQSKLSEWRQEREALKARLGDGGDVSRTAKATGQKDIERILGELERIHARMTAANPADAREAFRSVFERVTVTWHERRKGQNYRLASIAIKPHAPNRVLNGNGSFPIESSTLVYPDKVSPSAGAIRAAKAVEKHQNGRPAKFEDICRELGMKCAATRSLLDRARQSGLVTNCGPGQGWRVSDTQLHALVCA